MSYVFRPPHNYRTKRGDALFLLLAAASAVSGTAANTFANTGTLRGTGALAGTCPLAFSNSGTVTQPNGALAGSAALTFADATNLTGTGALLGACALTITPTATGSSANALQPAMRVKYRRLPTIPWDYSHSQGRVSIFPYSVSTATAGIGSVAFQCDAILRGTGRLAGNAAVGFSNSGSMVAGGNLAGQVGDVLSFTPTATLTAGANGQVSGNAGFALTESGLLTGTANLVGNSFIDIGATGSLAVPIPTTASVAMVFGGSGTLRNTTEGSGVITAMSFASTDGLQMFFSA